MEGNKMKKYKRGIILFALIAALLVGSVYTAPVADARASLYLDLYTGGVSKSGNTLTIDFYVVGTGMLDTIGASTIRIYESSNGTKWTLVETFNSSTTSSMVRSNYYVHDSLITYTCVSSRQYYAIITFYGADSKGSDSKNYTTNIA